MTEGMDVPERSEPPVPALGDTGEREVGTCAGCGRYGNWLRDEVSIWCGACGGAGEELTEDQ